ncbi:hypothetical protein FHG87_023253, partial [Trinorchestia longiramus]
HKQVLDYKRANFELMEEELGSYNYEVLMNDKNAEECHMILQDKIATATDHHIPRKRIRTTNNPPWFSQEIKRFIIARQHSYRRFKRYQTEPHRQEHIHACRVVKRTIKSTKRSGTDTRTSGRAKKQVPPEKVAAQKTVLFSNPARRPHDGIDTEPNSVA